MEKLTKKDWIYVGGAVASLIALWLLFFWRNGSSVVLPPAAQSDAAGPIDNSTSYPSQYSYNMPPLLTEPLQGTNPGDTSAGNLGCACPSAFGCAGTSMLDTGSAYTSLTDLLDYYKTMQPNFYNSYSAMVAPYSTFNYQGAAQVSAT